MIYDNYGPIGMNKFVGDSHCKEKKKDETG